MKNILIIITSHSEMENTDASTGVWLGEFTDPYYEFIDAGYQVTLASPEGGEPPIDPMSQLTEMITGSNRRFQDDNEARRKFENTLMLEAIRTEEYDGIFIPGGHGPVWDLARNDLSGRIILEFMRENKPVAAVCHGPAALLAAEALQPGLLKGKKITGFSNTEETLALRSRNVPYKLETRLKELGADYSATIIPFATHVVKDGLLITGQNPLSAGPAARALIDALQKRMN